MKERGSENDPGVSNEKGKAENVWEVFADGAHCGGRETARSGNNVLEI